MSRDDEPIEGRTRRGGQLVVIGVGVALLLALPSLYDLISGDTRTPRQATTSPNESALAGQRLHGRLVFISLDTEGSAERRQRLWAFDLRSGDLVEGPLVPAAEELWVTNQSPQSIVIVADDGGAEGVAYVINGLSPDTEPVEIARGDVISLATNGRALIVGRTEPAGGEVPGCEPRSYTLHRVDLDTAEEALVLRGREECGNLVSATLHRDMAVASFVDHGRVEVRSIWPTNVSTLFPDFAHVSVSPRGTFLFVDPVGGLDGLGVWPRRPTGRILVWPQSGRPRPLVNGDPLVSDRVLAWSPDGGYVVVNGFIGNRRGMWLVYVPAGTAELLLPPNAFPRRPAFSGAAFDDAGDVFAGRPGRIVVRTPTGSFPIALPPEAPSPIGPIGWLP
ncbi:MAG TPA: hypothetical protein VFA08_13295 [Actinomycetota bacterium]|jgi:hypothetical protein|nr:hypothetical protein [Actinomycetota bacterium]